MSNQYPPGQPPRPSMPPSVNMPPQYWQGQPPPQPPGKKHTGLKIAGAVVGGLVLLTIIGSLSSEETGTPASTPVPTVTVTAKPTAEKTVAKTTEKKTEKAPQKKTEKRKSWSIARIEKALGCTSADMGVSDLGLDAETVKTLGLTDMDGCIGDGGEIYMVMKFKDAAHAQMVSTLLPDQGFEAFQVPKSVFAVATLDKADIAKVKRVLS